MSKKVLVAEPISERGLQILEKELEVDVLLKLKPEELIERIGDYDALIVRSETKVTKDVIDAASNLKIIGRAGVGVDNIDLEEATRKGIVVVNAPGGNTISAAEHTLALLFALTRRIPDANHALKVERKWERSKYLGVEITGKTLGLLGLGRIGTEVAKRARGLGMTVIAYDPFISKERADELGVVIAPFEEVIKTADYISVHTPLTKDTRHMIDRDAISKMKDGVRIINCARGGIIDEDALYEGITSGKVAGAALDVFETEPPFDSKLLELDNVIVTPHLGASTTEAQVNVAVTVAEEVANYLIRGHVRNAVNMAPISADALPMLTPYIKLSEMLGKLTIQLTSGRIKLIKITYGGEIAQKETGSEIVTIAALKGVLDHISSNVNFVNAPHIAKERGISVLETKTESIENFTSMITLQLETESETTTVSGTIFGKDETRIVRINDYWIDAPFSPYMLISRHINKPGVIGPVGMILGNGKINIGGMYVGGGVVGEASLMVLNIDSPVPNDILEEVKKVDGIIDAVIVQL
ncbi:MAG: D-3-phosphoglycerate dehydrogenase [Candidatus Syntrophoarchaeum caldarius]|uniref:D-3-phosphoglycerate dehydrogenase n=1 Tax=Candidatus Syntropharchaeum caldarium TaxID=1838285 RepID=A0A1F2PBM3_9EURY|nr:MAG: D-3-phosphoglycerate dehydrogenase [Candidatus Syntrophoarchaeum caldarius]